jgi:hypothetical protein
MVGANLSLALVGCANSCNNWQYPTTTITFSAFDFKNKPTGANATYY